MYSYFTFSQIPFESLQATADRSRSCFPKVKGEPAGERKNVSILPSDGVDVVTFIVNSFALKVSICCRICINVVCVFYCCYE